MFRVLKHAFSCSATSSSIHKRVDFSEVITVAFCDNFLKTFKQLLKKLINTRVLPSDRIMQSGAYRHLAKVQYEFV